MSFKEMNRKNYNKYSQSTLSKFDIIGSYFVNLYYNEFYIKAKNLKFQENYTNITEAYKNLLSNYVEFSQQQDFFKQIIKGIHTYCISTTRYTTMSHKECVDFMVSEFVPENLWNSLREQQKNKLFHESLINCIKEFTEKIIINYLYMIIDHHDNNENIIILQDLFLNIILLEKDRIFSKFINPNTNNLHIIKNRLQDILNDNRKLIQENKILKKKNSIFENLQKKNSNIILELQKNNKLLCNEINSLKKSYKDYITKNKVNITKNKTNSKIITKKNYNNTDELNTNIDELQIDNKSICNSSVNNKSVEKSLIPNKLEDNKSLDTIYIDEESKDEESKNEESKNEESDDNKSIDEESIDNTSVDEEFQSYFSNANKEIIKELEFDKSEDYEY